MSRRKRPEKPQGSFSASKNTPLSNQDTPEAEPRHRMRDEKSHISPLDALRKAQELSERVSKGEQGQTHTNTPEALTEPPEALTEPPETVSRETPPPVPSSTPMFGGGAGFNIGQMLSEDETGDEPVQEEVVPESVSRPATTGGFPAIPAKEDSTEEEGTVSDEFPPVPTREPATRVEQEHDPDFVDYVPSPFKKGSNSNTAKASEGDADKLFDTFVKTTDSNPDYEPVQSEGDAGIEPLIIKEPEPELTEEEDLINFRRITPDTDGDEPDFSSIRNSMMEKRERTGRNMPKIRRVVFQDIKRRGGQSLPLVKPSTKAVTASMFTPSRKLSPERYLSLYSMASPFSLNDKKSASLNPSYRRKLSPALKRALREDRPHYSEYAQPESYDIDAPLPDLIPSDFVEEGIPELFVEGGPSVEEVLKAKRAERRDAEGNIRKDLTSTDFVEEAFSEFFIDYAERHNKTYDELKAPATYSISDTLDDDILDWTPVLLPPATPSVSDETERLIPAGVVVEEDREYDAELSHEDYVDVEAVEDAEPVKAAQINHVTYREMYMESLDPDLFLSELFGDESAESATASESVAAIADAVSGVPVRAEGETVINRGWRKHNISLTAGAAIMLTVIVFGTTLMRGESLLIPAIISGAGILLAILIGALRAAPYRKFSIDFERAVIVQGKKAVQLSDIVAGEGTSYNKGSAFSPKTVSFSDGNITVKAVIEKASFKMGEEEAAALVELVNQTGIPYSSDTDLDDIEQKKFEGTKRNLSMLINSSFMK